MKAKQILLGISLLSILTACSDRFDEYPDSSDQNSNINKKSLKSAKEDSSAVTTNLFNRETGNLKTNTSQTSRTEQDSLYNKEIINETTTTTGAPISPGSGTEPETIDPTKPDRPK